MRYLISLLAAVLILLLSFPIQVESQSDMQLEALRNAAREVGDGRVDMNELVQKQQEERKRRRDEVIPPLIPTQCTWLEINYKWVQVCR
jgi:hypothetical protein